MRIFIFLVLSFSLHAQEVRVVSIYDADTFRVNVEGWPDIVGKNMPVRILGIDAPEIRGKCHDEKMLALKGRVFSRRKLFDAQKIELHGIKRGKYFRILAHVTVDGYDLGSLLIKEGLARRYDGGKRGEWCE